MNKKGYSKDYARILDGVAGDQVPKDLDLAPNILIKIQKRKGFQMQPRLKLYSAAGLVALVLVVLFTSVPGVAAAVGRWFGYTPGIGFVRQGQIRVLEHPVSLTRAGVTVTVDQVILNQERIVLVYSVEGIPSTATVNDPQDPRCPYKVTLRLPDGNPLLASPDGLQYWGSGYKHRFDYPPVLTAVNDATLVVDCLFNTRTGAAPADWEIPLHFIPAPPGLTAYPVLEIPTLTPPAATATPSQNATEKAAELAIASTEVSQELASMTITLDRAVQMEDGYLIYATLNWQDTPFTSVDVADATQTLHLLDGGGQEMLYEVRYDEQTGVNTNRRQTAFAIKTAPVRGGGPLTLALDSVSVDLPVNASFVFDPGFNPKPGQTWTLNQDVKIGEYNLRVKTATADASSYRFEMSSEDGILNATLVDLIHPILAVVGGGGSANSGENLSYAIHYVNGLPDGPLTVTVSAISVRHIQRIEAQWMPPAVSPNLLSTQPAACLTAATWNAAVAQKPTLPDGISGRVLASGQFDKPDSDAWSLIIFNLENSTQQKIDGAQDGALSPDGSKLAYSTFDKGLFILDLAANQTTPLPGTSNGDFNPIWSPEGKQIVFMRGMGVFDLFIVEADGTNMRQITHGGVQEWPVGWLPDGRLVYTVPGRENEYTHYAVDIQNGKTGEIPNINLSSTSPDGRYTLTSEKTFGDRWLITVSELDGSNRWLLNDSSLWVLTPLWSPDRQWLIAEVSGKDSESTIGALINLRTCQVIPMPGIQGNLLSWVP